MSLLAVPGVISGGGGFDPVTIPNQLGRWDWTKSTITTSGGLVTQVSDLVGTKHLVGPYYGVSGPEDIASDADLGTRAAKVLYNPITPTSTAYTVEDLGVATLGDTGSSTLACVCTIDSDWAYQGILAAYTSGGANVSVSTNGAGKWMIDDGINPYYESGTTMSLNTPYLIVFENNGTSSRLLVNGTVKISSPGTFASTALDAIGLGYENNRAYQTFATYAFAIATSDIMSAGDQAGLLEYAQATFNV